MSPSGGAAAVSTLVGTFVIVKYSRTFVYFSFETIETNGQENNAYLQSHPQYHSYKGEDSVNKIWHFWPAWQTFLSISAGQNWPKLKIFRKKDFSLIFGCFKA